MRRMKAEDRLTQKHMGSRRRAVERSLVQCVINLLAQPSVRGLADRCTESDLQGTNWQFPVVGEWTVCENGILWLVNLEYARPGCSLLPAEQGMHKRDTIQDAGSVLTWYGLNPAWRL